MTAFRDLAEQITARMGEDWTLTGHGGALSMTHGDGRAVELCDSGTGRVIATARYPRTGLSPAPLATSAALGRDPAAIARQISGHRFMGAYTAALARVRAHAERKESEAGVRAALLAHLEECIPPDRRAPHSAGRPNVVVRPTSPRDQQERPAWERESVPVVDVAFRDLTPAQASAVMRAYAAAMDQGAPPGGAAG